MIFYWCLVKKSILVHNECFILFTYYIMQTSILVIICIQFCVYIYVVLKWASNAQRLYKEKDEVYKLEKQIWEKYRKEILTRIKNIEERQELLLYRYKRKEQ